MQCPTCSAEIPEESRFCLYCGATIGELQNPIRPSVDGFALLQHYIPPELARKILTAGRQIESERRHVTVLFADVTGFTALAEKTDVEIVSTVLNECFRGLISIILRYEGTIDKFIGDGIMAIFGAPLAHENDPERAARCALDMLSDIERFNAEVASRLPVPLGLHIGLHSGMVIAGNVGSDLRMNYSVIGDTVNLAARLVEVAPKGEVYMSAETCRLVSGIAVAEGPFPTSFRGKSGSVDVFKLRALKPASEIREGASAEGEFVGREQELDRVARALDQVAETNHARLFIRGEAGVGKSRLQVEIVKLAQRRGYVAYTGICSSFEVNTPYFLWTTLLRSILKIAAETSEKDARAHLHETLQGLNLTDQEPYLATLLSLRYEEILLVDDTLRKRRIFQAMGTLLSAIARRSLIVFILEDLHWIDRFSQELLEYLFSRDAPTVLSLFVILFRGEYQQARRMSRDDEVIDLNRLNPDDARRLMRLRLGADDVPPQVEDLVLKRSEGNPFFLGEILKMLVDKKVVAVTKGRVEVLSEDIESGIPETIQGVIMARIDRLQDSIKEVLFGASVIGREFSMPVLEQVLERNQDLVPNLLQLQSLELILEKDEASEFEYLFKHFLIQEVAYNTILLNKRKELHALIARSIEHLYPDRLVEFYELLAFHYEKAEEWDKAAEYLSRSGHKVKQMYSTEESKGFFERKKVAVTKLYESVSAKGSFFATVKAITPPLIALLIPIVPIFIYVRLLGRSHGEDFSEEIIVGILASLLLVWYVISLWFLGVVPFLRGRPKLYDLMEDQIRVIYRDRTTLSIHFSEIASLRYFDPKLNKLRPWKYRILDPFGRLSGKEVLSVGLWLREVFLNILPPYSFGFGAGQGEVHVRLNEGYAILRVLVPWWNTPVKSRDLSLLPFDAHEFYAQLEVALAKWRLKGN